MTAAPLPERLQQLLTHWHDLRAGAAVPMLADFLDRPMPRLQPWIGIFDIESELSWPARLSGTEVVAFFKADFTGLNFADLISDAARPVFQFSLPEIGRARCGLYHLNRTSTSKGRHFYMHVMGLPVVRREEKPSVVWMINPEEALAHDEVALPVHDIIAQRWIDLGHGVPTQFVQPRPSPGFGRAPAPYLGVTAAP